MTVHGVQCLHQRTSSFSPMCHWVPAGREGCAKVRKSQWDASTPVCSCKPNGFLRSVRLRCG